MAYRNADTFTNYRQFVSKRDSDATCGHKIAKGQVVGWHPQLKKTCCATCWEHWKRQNMSEASMELYGTDCAFDC